MRRMPANKPATHANKHKRTRVTQHGKKSVSHGDVIIRPEHNVISPSKTIWRTLAFSGANFSSFFNGTEQQFNMRIPHESYDSIKSMVVEIPISVATNRAVLVAVPYFFTRIELWRMVDGQRIQTFYPETMMMNLATLSAGQREDLFPALGLDSKTWWNRESDCLLQAGESKTFYLPLLGSIFDAAHGIDISQWETDLEIRFVFRASIRAENTGIITCGTCNLLIENEASSHADLFAQDKHLAKMTRKINFIDWIDSSTVGQTLTASTSSNFVLNQIQDVHVPFLLFGVRASQTSVVNHGQMNFLDFGETATFDVLNVNGQSIIGGQALRAEFLKNVVMPAILPSDISRMTNLYVIPWTDNIKATLGGQVSGAHHFEDNTYRLQITPSAATTQQVWTCGNSATAASGGYSITVKTPLGTETTGRLAFDANGAVIADAIESLPVVYGLPGRPTFAASASFAANGTTVTASVSAAKFVRDITIKLVESDLQDAGGADVTITLYVDTHGTRGFTTGSTYNLAVFAPVFRELLIENGMPCVKNIENL